MSKGVIEAVSLLAMEAIGTTGTTPALIGFLALLKKMFCERH